MSENSTHTFWQIKLPNGRTAYLPDDINVKLPEDTDVAPERVHLLAHIPWVDKYLDMVPDAYRAFFRFTLPYLNARTTDVHTALSVSHIAELIKATPDVVNENILYSAVILHDSGWAQLSHQEIADSLDYSAVAYSPRALKPKEAHATLGAKMAQKLLSEHDGDLGLSTDQQTFVQDLVYYHDQIRPWPTKPEPVEYLLLGDADRLWSYTHENFWLDTIRKNVAPTIYVKTLKKH
jgi:hypothetical protein